MTRKPEIEDTVEDVLDMQDEEADLDGQYPLYPPSIQKRLNALRKLRDDQVQLESQFRVELFKLEKEFAARYEPLWDRREAIASGRENPTEEEASYVSPDDLPQITPADEEDEGEDEEVTGIPNFWQTVFINNPFFAETISERDFEAFAFLKDVKLVYTGDELSYRIDFVFDENPYFTNKVLSKTFLLTNPDAPGVRDLSFGGSTGTTIDWKKGMDLTHRTTQKIQRQRGTNRTRTAVSTEKVDSFFDLFESKEVRDDGEEKDEQEADEDEFDYQAGEILRNMVIPYAVDWFTGAALDYFDEDNEEDYEDMYGDEDDEDEDDEDDDEDDDDEDDEDEDDDAPAPRKGKGKGKHPTITAEKPAECAQQ